MAEVAAKWVEGFQFVATGTGGHSIVTDAAVEGGGQGHGFKPSELLLAALAGCTGYDVVEILKKQRQSLTGLQVRVKGDQIPDPPWTYHTCQVEYIFQGKGLNETLVKRAIELSETKYCSVGSTISGKCKIVSSYQIIEE